MFPEQIGQFMFYNFMKSFTRLSRVQVFFSALSFQVFPTGVSGRNVKQIIFFNTCCMTHLYNVIIFLTFLFCRKDHTLSDDRIKALNLRHDAIMVFRVLCNSVYFL
jgi:hypothetical protein